MVDKKKIVLLAALAAVILGVFLSVSRAPALDEKALMGTRTDIAGIAFDQLTPVDASDSSMVRVAKNAINWTYTNWRGMTFGLLFGATILTLLRAIPLWKFSQNRFIASLQGLLGGAPLGVCVNCATPVAQGMLGAGARVETSLTTMMASPTLNFIVITMMLSLFQTYFVVLKLALTVLFILIVVPLIVWLSGSRDQQSSAMPVVSVPSPADPGIRWADSMKQTVVDWLSNFLFLLRVSVPLMVLAGLLGAVMLEFVPLHDLDQLQPEPLTYITVALIGTLLPVPIAFDVVVTAGLIAAGFPLGLAMTLFFSLSIFSIFPALIIARDVSIRLSLLIVISVSAFSILAGYSTALVHGWVVDEQKSQLEMSLGQIADVDSKVAATVSSGQLLQGKVNRAESLCAEVGDRMPDCPGMLLEAGAFGFTDETLCEELAGLNALLGRGCDKQRQDREQAALAIASNDLLLCKSDECRLTFLRANSHLATSIGQCATLSPERLHECRQVIVASRLLHFRSAKACELPDIPNPERCLQDLATNMAIEQLDAETCLALPEPASRNCMYGFLAGKMRDSAGTYRCEARVSAVFGELCDNLALAEQAQVHGNWQACEALPVGMSDFCLRRILTDLVKSDVSWIGLPAQLSREPASTVALNPVTSSANLPFESVGTIGGIEVRRTPHLAGAVSGRFVMRDANDIGMSHFWQMDGTDLFEPFAYGKGIAAGDVNRDGLPDVVLAYEKGAYLYQNVGQGKFELIADLRPDEDFNAFVASFFDFDNDGFLDVFLSGYGGKRVIYLNRQATFNLKIDLPSGEAPITIAVGFADLDRDGLLDIVMGNWAYGVERNFNTFSAGNELWFHEGETLSRSTLMDNEPAGQTLSVLLTDLNGDGQQDIVVGNDRQVPDIFYIGGGDRSFAYPPKGYVGQSSLNTMSYESADFNNDLKTDLFSTDMRFGNSGRTSFCDLLEPSAANTCSRLTRIETMVDQHDIAGCMRQDEGQSQCLIAVAMTLAIREQAPGLCEKIPALMASKRSYCMTMSAALPEVGDINLEQYPLQVTTNKMHWGRGGHFLDVTEALSVSRTNWSWNARALDFDNDGYSDLYVGNGYGFGSEGRAQFLPNIQVHSNVLFRNDAGRRFVPSAAQYGLEDFTNTPAFTVLDVDLDGDMDVLTYAQIAGPRLYENQVNEQQRMTIALKDGKGNFDCIGCRVVIETADGARVKEIKLSGGFMSFDQPIAHFGLANEHRSSSFTVYWSTGEKTELDLVFEAGFHYEIIRQ